MGVVISFNVSKPFRFAPRFNEFFTIFCSNLLVWIQKLQFLIVQNFFGTTLFLFQNVNMSIKIRRIYYPSMTKCLFNSPQFQLAWKLNWIYLSLLSLNIIIFFQGCQQHYYGAFDHVLRLQDFFLQKCYWSFAVPTLL